MAFTKAVKDRALLASRRHCCLCWKYWGTKIITHHIIPIEEGGDDTFENCIPLCLTCHAEVGNYNPKHPLGRKISPEELKRLRDRIYEQIENGTFKPIQDNNNEISNQTIILGNQNIVAGHDININKKVTQKTVVQLDPGGKHITSETARILFDLVTELSDMKVAAGYDVSKARIEIWSSLNRKFKVTKYALIPYECSDDAIRYMHLQINMARPALRRKNPDMWKKSLYKPIYARANELGISKDELYTFAYQKIPLKKPISSLTELTMRDLERLNNLLKNLKRKSTN
jgi:hypothetical protein